MMEVQYVALTQTVKSVLGGRMMERCAQWQVVIQGKESVIVVRCVIWGGQRLPATSVVSSGYSIQNQENVHKKTSHDTK